MTDVTDVELVAQWKATKERIEVAKDPTSNVYLTIGGYGFGPAFSKEVRASVLEKLERRYDDLTDQIVGRGIR